MTVRPGASTTSRWTSPPTGASRRRTHGTIRRTTRPAASSTRMRLNIESRSSFLVHIRRWSPPRGCNALASSRVRGFLDAIAGEKSRRKARMNPGAGRADLVESNTVPRVDTPEWHRIDASEWHVNQMTRAPCEHHRDDRMEFATIIYRRGELTGGVDMTSTVKGPRRRPD